MKYHEPQAVLREILAALTAALATPPNDRELPSDAACAAALGHSLGLKKISEDDAFAALVILQELRAEQTFARFAGWKPDPPLSADAMTSDGKHLLWPGGVGYLEYLAVHAAQQAPVPPCANRNRLESIWRIVQQHRESSAENWAAQLEAARKAVGPALARGADRAAVLSAAYERAPAIMQSDIEIIVDEEVAWWLR